jgi:hypothetical protein
MRFCPKCGHPGLDQPPCSLCRWQPEPPPVETHLLVGEQVITLTWVEEAGVRVGMTVGAQRLQAWLRRRGK